jgi:integrase
VGSIRKSFALAVRRAGLSGGSHGNRATNRVGNVTPHTLRHTAATWGIQRGVSIWEMAGFLGMSPQILSTVYGHHSPDFQENAAEALSRKP